MRKPRAGSLKASPLERPAEAATRNAKASFSHHLYRETGFPCRLIILYTKSR